MQDSLSIIFVSDKKDLILMRNVLNNDNGIFLINRLQIQQYFPLELLTQPCEMKGCSNSVIPSIHVGFFFNRDSDY